MAIRQASLVIEAKAEERFDPILSHEALGFLEDLARRFGPRIREALERRAERQVGLANGETLDFLAETESIRAKDWSVAPLPHDLLKRVVEITGPVDRKMVINALNSGADGFMSNFTDATTPTSPTLIEAQLNLPAS